MEQKYNHLDDGSLECLDCGCVTSKEDVANDDIEHWSDCPRMINDDDTDPQGDK